MNFKFLYWTSWAYEFNYQFPIDLITRFVTYLFLKKSVSTIRSYLSAISFAHKARSIPDNIKASTVSILLNGIRKIATPAVCRYPINLGKIKFC